MKLRLLKGHVCHGEVLATCANAMRDSEAFLCITRVEDGYKLHYSKMSDEEINLVVDLVKQHVLQEYKI